MKQNKHGGIRLSRLVALVWVAGVACMVATAYAKPEQDGMDNAQKGRAGVKRDPFWPVGYVPEKSLNNPKTTTTAAAGNGWNEAMKKVVINGVSSRTDNEYFAIINAEVKSVGDTVSVTLGNSTYTWAVDGIEPPGSVKLRRVSVR